MFKVKIDNEIILAEEGAILSDVLIKSGKKIDHPCGGRGVCKKCKLFVDGKEELSCQYRVHSDISVTLPENKNILSETGAEENGKVTENMCFVLDIGTTTLALALVSLDDKKIIRVVTSTNPQRIFGADIMTRIDYCSKNSVKELNDVIIAELNKMIAEFNMDHINTLYVAANVTMLHLFFGVDCSSIGYAPYTPAFLESKEVKASDIGIKNIDKIVSLPSISSFVGADLVSGMNYVGMPGEGKYNLLVDLGTNAEIILFSKEFVLCTAAAAGPCFEGANIDCGMSATAGAIYSFKFDEQGNQTYKTISDEEPTGICGTGLVDMLSELLKTEEIDETGFMEEDQYDVTDKVFLSQKDVRQFQLAKSAVYSAIMTLVKIKNISLDDIEHMYISGGFSAKINIDNASYVGLLPSELISKCVAINNSSLLGCVKFACENNDLSIYLHNAKYVDLSSDEYFTDLFVDNMMFEFDEQ